MQKTLSDTAQGQSRGRRWSTRKRRRRAAAGGRWPRAMRKRRQKGRRRNVLASETARYQTWASCKRENLLCTCLYFLRDLNVLGTYFVSVVPWISVGWNFKTFQTRLFGKYSALILWNGDLSSHSTCMSKVIKAPALMAVRMVHAKQGIGAKAFKASGMFSMCVSEFILSPVNIHSACWKK